MRIKATILWNFNKVTVSGVKCGECKKYQIRIKLTDGSTSGIRYHLKTKHPTDYAKMLRAQIKLGRQRKEDIKEITEAAFELNDASALEEMIQKYQVLDAVPEKVIVHDAAANMKHAMSIMNKIKYESLLCADHLLNTSLLHATNEVQEVKDCIDIATQLSSKVQRSTLACQLIEKECMLLCVNYVKIIAPVKTRWNSNCFMMESILKLKDVLISLREKLNNNPLQNVIPSDK
ncbi:uncharacterized protein LOC136077010 [Hydra vulgaris]|uniref:Uncharacterized protein LOC136077010 n=1 Tax=Hydra vulgaris TaxID=6087 RepID=A0ABM4BE94_HYDVU